MDARLWDLIHGRIRNRALFGGVDQGPRQKSVDVRWCLPTVLSTGMQVGGEPVPQHGVAEYLHSTRDNLLPLLAVFFQDFVFLRHEHGVTRSLFNPQSPIESGGKVLVRNKRGQLDDSVITVVIFHAFHQIGVHCMPSSSDDLSEGQRRLLWLLLTVDENGHKFPSPTSSRGFLLGSQFAFHRPFLTHKRTVAAVAPQVLQMDDSCRFR